jgi:hypothetical protein
MRRRTRRTGPTPGVPLSRPAYARRRQHSLSAYAWGRRRRVGDGPVLRSYAWPGALVRAGRAPGGIVGRADRVVGWWPGAITGGQASEGLQRAGVSGVAAVPGAHQGSRAVRRPAARLYVRVLDDRLEEAALGVPAEASDVRAVRRAEQGCRPPARSQGPDRSGGGGPGRRTVAAPAVQALPLQRVADAGEQTPASRKEGIGPGVMLLKLLRSSSADSQGGRVRPHEHGPGVRLGGGDIPHFGDSKAREEQT